MSGEVLRWWFSYNVLYIFASFPIRRIRFFIPPSYTTLLLKRLQLTGKRFRIIIYESVVIYEEWGMNGQLFALAYENLTDVVFLSDSLRNWIWGSRGSSEVSELVTVEDRKCTVSLVWLNRAGFGLGSPTLYSLLKSCKILSSLWYGLYIYVVLSFQVQSMSLLGWCKGSGICKWLFKIWCI